MILKPKEKPRFTNFSSGPTKKPSEWSLSKLNYSFLGRYHRSMEVKNYLNEILLLVKYILKIPKNYKILLSPGSCTGAMTAIIHSLLGDRVITSIIYDYWGKLWSDEIIKAKYKQEVRYKRYGVVPPLENIKTDSDIFFVWTGTSAGISINEINWISNKHEGLVISDISSSVFIEKINWKKLDVSFFSWQKALGSESQHGLIILSPKALERLKFKKKKKIVPKILNINENNFMINTPSLLCFADFKFCLDWLKKKGGLNWSNKTSNENCQILRRLVKNNTNIEYFVKDSKHQAISCSYFLLSNQNKSRALEKVFEYLKHEKIAFDIQAYRKMPIGIRIWTGPTILKKDLIALTKWLDWSFYKFFK